MRHCYMAAFPALQPCRSARMPDQEGVRELVLDWALSACLPRNVGCAVFRIQRPMRLVEIRAK